MNSNNYKTLLVKIPPADIKKKYVIALKAVNQAEVINSIEGYDRPIVIFNRPPGIMADIGGLAFRVFWMIEGEEAPNFKGQFDQDIEVLTLSELKLKASPH